jgi:hypothetical protein
MTTSDPDTRDTIACDIHGERPCAIVCRHHIDVRDRAVGFVENSTDPDDLQAWCDDCESLFLREGGKTESFRAFNAFGVVCVDCYARLRAHHSGEPAAPACSGCGRVHDELPRYFMTKLPEAPDGSIIQAKEERKSMCRTKRQSFVRCEVEVPLLGSDDGPLGFICWVEISRADYRRLLAFRKDEGSAAAFPDWVSGTLANTLRGIPGTFGTAVKFQVLRDDPTPYIKWVAPGTPLAALVTSGASVAFWHEVAGSAP